MSTSMLIVYARSGGTLMNRCLAALDGVVMMSEVNPLGGGRGGRPRELGTIAEQAAAWYGIDVPSGDFKSEGLALERVCRERGLHLVLRDWTYIEFAPRPENHFLPPNQLIGYEVLKAHLPVTPVALVRDGIDVWLSAGRPTPEYFFSAYLRYIYQLEHHSIPVVKYEDLVKSPEATVRHVCAILGLPFSVQFKNFTRIEGVNGDVQLARGSRGGRLSTIEELPRTWIPKREIRRINGCGAMRLANNLLGYPADYYSRLSESPLDRGIRKAVGRLNNIQWPLRKRA